MTGAILTREGEDALRRLNGLAAFYRRLAFLPDPEPPGRLMGARRASSVGRTLQETVIVRSVTIVEAYMTDLGRRLVDDHLRRVPAGDLPLASLAVHLRDSRMADLDHGKWEELVTLWSDGLDIALQQQFTNYARLAALRTTRHAIVHRYGDMTPQYRKQHRQRLIAEGFRDPLSAEGLVPLTRADVLDALELCLATVRWFETQLANL
jgi:hypothetical protein